MRRIVCHCSSRALCAAMSSLTKSSPFTIVPPMNRCSTCMKARMRYAHAPGLLFSLAHSGGEIGWRKRLPGAIKGDGRDLEALTVLHDLNRRKLAGVLAMSGGKEGSA